MAYCIKCEQGEGEKEICSGCLGGVLAKLTIEDCIDIRERMERVVRTRQRWERVKAARAGKGDESGEQATKAD